MKQHDKTTSLSLHSLYSSLVQNPLKIRLSVQISKTVRRNSTTKQQALVCFFAIHKLKKKQRRQNLIIKGTLESNETRPTCLNKPSADV
jgi:hypothetical protein